jgi:erythronate-4-phosphate dehydrogenase
VPRLLLDADLAAGQPAALPLTWLDGFELVPFPPRGLTAAVAGASAADAVIVRTMTRLPAALLAALPGLRAVATLSSGTDHLDEAALAARGVALHTGHGGNALAVADWVAWALAATLDRSPDRAAWLGGRRVLLIGVGAVGAAVAARLRSAGAEVGCCDPPRAAREPGFRSLNLDEALAQRWDAVSLHVPLTTAGPHPTANLLDRGRLCRLRGAVVLNAARGGVLDEAAAAELRCAGHLAGLALDTFVGEPLPRAEVVAACDRATPHIGGHAIEGKLRVSRRAVSGLRRQFELAPPGALADAVAAVMAGHDPAELQPDVALAAADASLRACVAAGESFDRCRSSHRRVELTAGADGVNDCADRGGRVCLGVDHG